MEKSKFDTLISKIDSIKYSDNVTKGLNELKELIKFYKACEENAGNLIDDTVNDGKPLPRMRRSCHVPKDNSDNNTDTDDHDLYGSYNLYNDNDTCTRYHYPRDIGHH
jgi:hypothetical protein